MNENTKETIITVSKTLVAGAIKVAWFVTKASFHYFIVFVTSIPFYMMKHNR